MTNNIVQLPISWNDPDIEMLQRVGSEYLNAWHKQRYAFLPQLHELLERHARFFIASVEKLHSNAERVRVTIRASNLRDIAQDISPNDPVEDVAEYFELAQEAVSDVAKVLRNQVNHLSQALRDGNALSLYDVSRDKVRLQGELDKLAKDQSIYANDLEARQADLASMDEAIKVLEAARVESSFQGLLPTAQQLKDAAAVIAAGGVTVEAVEGALKKVSALIGAALEGMRYSAILDQRRTLQRTVGELEVTLRGLEQRKRVTEERIGGLEAYPQLVQQRSQWIAGFDRIARQLEPVFQQLNGVKINELQVLLAIEQLIDGLHAYKNRIIADFRPGR